MAKDNVERLVVDFHSLLLADVNHRYKSWEHCYSFFKTEEANNNIDISCLHLSFYLASWGMYRGSSFLLWKDYRIHLEVVRKIIDNKDLQKLDFSSINDVHINRVMDLLEWIRGWYSKNIKTVNGVSKSVNVTDTLVTKILLGTLGCIPAYDRYFINGMRSSGLSFSKLRKSSYQSVVDFYKTHKKEFDNAQNVIYKKSNFHYPSMKLVDMYFWEIGFQADN